MKIEETRDLDRCRALRRKVFIEEQGVAEAEEWDGLDGQALHLLVWQDGTAIGTARILIKVGTGKIGRVCVLPEARGAGHGAALIRAAVTMLQARPGITRAMLGAQTHAIGFYQKLGFSVCGPIYDDAGIPHRDMSRDL